ncbi:hypothetical protein ACE014_10765 [Shewanella xiamenensis]|uniref:hypothetical protein n=1 Tax=Shewanella xiamenensis TaxID=332186 RepID=UPI0035BA7F6F
MVFRPIRVLVATAALTIFGYAAMFLYSLTQPLCIDDLSEVSDAALIRAKQGDTSPMHISATFDKEKNQWCYVEVVQ